MTSYYDRTEPLPAHGFEEITIEQRAAKKFWSLLSPHERRHVDTDPTDVNRANLDGREI